MELRELEGNREGEKWGSEGLENFYCMTLSFCRVLDNGCLVSRYHQLLVVWLLPPLPQAAKS